MSSKYIAKAICTLILVFCGLGSTVIFAAPSESGNVVMAGLVISLILTMIHLVSIPLAETSVNPARSIRPPLFVGGTAMAQLWLFIAAPFVGGAIGGLFAQGTYHRNS